MLGVGPTVKEITGKSLRLSKEENDKAQVKNSVTLLNIYYFTSTFQGISLDLKEFVWLFIKTGFINTVLSKINLYIQEVSSRSYLLFDFSPVKRRENTNSLEREHKTICLFRNNFSIRTLRKRERESLAALKRKA